MIGRFVTFSFFWNMESGRKNLGQNMELMEESRLWSLAPVECTINYATPPKTSTFQAADSSNQHCLSSLAVPPYYNSGHTSNHPDTSAAAADQTLVQASCVHP